jgi:hypothetical protein
MFGVLDHKIQVRISLLMLTFYGDWQEYGDMGKPFISFLVRIHFYCYEGYFIRLLSPKEVLTILVVCNFSLFWLISSTSVFNNIQQ